MTSKHPLLNKPDATPAIAASLAIAAFASIGLGLVLYLLAPPNGWYHGTPFTLDLKELFVLWTDTWSSATPVSDIGSIAKLLLHLISWPCSLLAERGVLTPFAIYFATTAVAGGACGRIVFKAVIKGLPPVRRVTTTIGSEPRYGKYGARHINEAWLDRLVAEGKGIFLAPGVALPRGVETEHLATIGTTGSGKSTTVSSLWLHLAAQQAHRVVAIEDPIEFVYPTRLGPSMFTMRELDTSCESYETALLEVRRQNATAVSIGEIRGAESAEKCLRFALIGLLVVATIHGENVPATESGVVEAPHLVHQ